MSKAMNSLQTKTESKTDSLHDLEKYSDIDYSRS